MKPANIISLGLSVNKMFLIFLKIFFFLFILTSINIAYKGKTFDKKSWNRSILLSSWFIICSFVLLSFNYQEILIIANYLTISIFIIITLLWFIFPKIIRLYGKYPSSYLKNKKNNERFMVKFELPSMTIKYFEVLFQQTTFLFLLFVLLIDLQKITSIFLFTLIIIIIHLGNLFFMDKKWALFYTVLSIPMAIAFGYMILEGFVLLTASIHLLFYLIFNASYWFTSNIKTKQSNL